MPETQLASSNQGLPSRGRVDFEGEEGALKCSSLTCTKLSRPPNRPPELLGREAPRQNSANPSVCIVKKDRLFCLHRAKQETEL